MNDIRDLFPGRMRERTFQLKAKRDAGAVWHEQQFVTASFASLGDIMLAEPGALIGFAPSGTRCAGIRQAAFRQWSAQ